MNTVIVLLSLVTVLTARVLPDVIERAETMQDEPTAQPVEDGDLTLEQFIQKYIEPVNRKNEQNPNFLLETAATFPPTPVPCETIKGYHVCGKENIAKLINYLYEPIDICTGRKKRSSDDWCGPGK